VIVQHFGIEISRQKIVLNFVQVDTMKEDVMPGVFSQAQDEATDYFLWVIVLCLLGSAVYFFLLKKRERGNMTQTVEIHSKLD
jgi:prolipoprotein diacylglyceryltransferase